MIKKSNLPNKKRGEEIILHLRRHRFIFFTRGILIFILLIIPLGLSIFAQEVVPNLLEGAISAPILSVLVYIYYLVIILLALTLWTGTYLDVWTVTNERIINREQHGLFNRVVSELDLYRIQDVTAEQKGFFPTILHYGNVYIQSAGVKERFIFEQIPSPYKVAKIIQKLDERAKREHEHQQ
jgi:hypothetical protein